MYKTPHIGVDTIRFIATLTALKKELRKLNLEYDNQVSISLLEGFKKEVLRADKRLKKEDFNLEVISISQAKSLLGYMLIKKNNKSIFLSKKQKRAKDHKREVIFTGLNQPTNKPHQRHLIASYDVIKQLVARFKVDTIDLSIDGCNSIVISNRTKYLLNNVFSDYINDKSNIQLYQTSYYLNNPINTNNPRFSFDKILVYDKFIKESKKKNRIIKWDKLKHIHIDWKRLEVTVKITNEKLNISLLDEIVNSISSLSMGYFSDYSLNDTLLTKQKQLLELRG